MTLAMSTTWNVARTGGFAASLAEIRRLGFTAVELAGEGPDLASVPAALRETRLSVVAADAGLGRTARAPADRLEPGFASLVESERERAVSALLAVAARAKRCGTDRVAVRCGVVAVPGADERFEDWARRSALGGVDDGIREEARTLLEERAARRDAHLDAACRTLHALVRADPETHWWILPAARPHALPLADEIEHLLAEIPGDRPASVLDPATAAVQASLGAGTFESWLDAGASRVAAARLSDAFGLEAGLPPGAGTVDLRRVREGLAPSLPRILRITRECGAEEVLEAARAV
jgi:sugar phosphate isomerase/epimerase